MDKFFSKISKKDLIINLIMFSIIFLSGFFVFKNYKKNEHFENPKEVSVEEELSDVNKQFFGKCIDIYPKWGKSKNYKHFEKKYPECFTEAHYEKIKNEILKIFNKMNKYNIPEEFLCNLINNAVKEKLANPKAVKIFYDAYPKCQKIEKFNVDNYVDKLLQKHKIEENFENQKNKETLYDLDGLTVDINEIYKIIAKKYPNRELVIELFGEDSEEEIKKFKQKELNKKSNEMRKKIEERSKKQTEKQNINLELIDSVSDLNTKQYIEWLNMYRKTPEMLSKFHMDNLQRLVNQNDIKIKNMPDEDNQNKLFSNPYKTNIEDTIIVEDIEKIGKNNKYLEKLNYYDLNKNYNVINLDPKDV